MKSKKSLYVLLGILAVLFICSSVFFALQGFFAANKLSEYFDVYQDKAEEYIKSDAEILSKYGDDISVEFDSYTYRESGEREFFDIFIEVFAPKAPDSLEEFTRSVEMINFKARINGDLHEIIFEKNGVGELAVSKLTQTE